MFRQESMTLTGANNSRYRQYIIGTAGYNFDNRYMAVSYTHLVRLNSASSLLSSLYPT